MKQVDAAPQLQWLALSLSPNIGASTLNNLREYFDQDLDAVLQAPSYQLMRVRGVGPKIASEIGAIDLDRLAQDLEAWRADGIEILMRGGEHYPQPLKETSDLPLALFTSRIMSPQIWSNAVAIVGTREPSKEARYITLQLAMQLARADRAVVSGLALGIDTAAHTGALSADGVTVAVLGSGIGNIYPEANRSLALRIRDKGALLSETHPHWSANAQRLVSRNRIVSGLCRAVIVVESDADGGAMYTARFAVEQGRPVYTFDLPAGGNQRLIAEGARVLRRDDPLRDLPGNLAPTSSTE
ncbi:MAG: DNA-processing protein DprA [Chloroflexi bacterium]|nr:DNA-processing protein DprA [Chloroflexota bacterium]